MRVLFVFAVSLLVLQTFAQKIPDLKFPLPPNFPADGEIVDGVPMEYKSENVSNWIVGIIGGVTVQDISEAPFIVALLDTNGRQFCGGSYIGVVNSAGWVLTAAHCVSRTGRYQLRLGSLRSTTGGQVINSNGVSVHPSYSGSSLDYDCALIRLANVPTLGTVRPIQRATAGSDFSGQMSTVAGWGAIREGGGTVAALMKVDVPIVTNVECRNSYSSVTARMVCAGYWEGGKDACQGDSGGPLWVGNRQVGIVSWGTGCARRGYYGVYSRVSEFDSWITSVTSA